MAIRRVKRSVLLERNQIISKGCISGYHARRNIWPADAAAEKLSRAQLLGL